MNLHEKGMPARIEVHSEDVLLKHAFAEIQRMLANEQIHIGDFRDMYDADKIANDLAYVAEKRSAFEAEATKDKNVRRAIQTALIFEGIFLRGGHDHGWLGKKDEARVMKASEVDDIRHGVDGIVEFKKAGAAAEHLVIGVDVTYSNQLKKKFQRMREDIENGTLATIEYFLSENFKGPLRNIPRVVIGAEHAHVIDLYRNMFVNPDSKRLTRHPFQIVLLKQMRLQLDAFAEYAKRYGKKDVENVYRRYAEIIRKILQEKSIGEGIRMGEWENDKVFLAIKQELKNLK